MKYGEAGMLELRTYPQGRFEVFVYAQHGRTQTVQGVVRSALTT